MAHSDLIRRLFASHIQSDDAGFRHAASELIAEERRKNHRLLADELERELNSEQRPGAGLALTLKAIPKSRDERPLLRLTKPRHELDDLVLASNVRTLVDEIVSEFRSRSILTSHGLRPRSRLILLGAPGTGKSATAHAIAAELSLPVATASLAALTSSFLGDTARNIESVVHFAEQTPCVLLLDEFDVLGQERSQAGDHGEMRRVAATVLQLLEDMQGESVVVATSNHPQLVDTAVWRRFDEVIGFGKLGQKQSSDLIKLRLRAHRSEITPLTWAKKLADCTPAEIELVCFDALRRTVLADKPAVDNEAMTSAWQRLRERLDTLAGVVTNVGSD
ncbi:AAA family ATPase [Amycolatopsis sp. lyj-108]|uniref:AAA family ATPase n=1 Tax=Amycolatopsis sp. lyj-108 TaxID=2789286 RepID=UPI00397DC527